MSKTLSLKPRLSEKTYSLSNGRVYVIDVPNNANKHTVTNALEEQFEVKVAKVNILNAKGKSKRVMSLSGKRVKNASGSRSDFKKAYVTLRKGYSLPFFEAVEEEMEKEQAAQEKFEKAAAKQSAKEDKAEQPKRGLRLRKKAENKEESK